VARGTPPVLELELAPPVWVPVPPAPVLVTDPVPDDDPVAVSFSAPAVTVTPKNHDEVEVPLYVDVAAFEVPFASIVVAHTMLEG
jgi:hypothetical protein